MTRKNIKEIVIEYIKANGFDGLQHDQECGCSLEDLMPCSDPNVSCSAAYIVTPPKDMECDFDFYMCENKTDKPWEYE